LSVVGISILLFGGLLSVSGMGILGGGLPFGMIIGIPVVILAILSLIFVGLSKNEFI
jgi:hypothetical protein